MLFADPRAASALGASAAGAGGATTLPSATVAGTVVAGAVVGSTLVDVSGALDVSVVASGNGPVVDDTGADEVSGTAPVVAGGTPPVAWRKACTSD